eukprot:1160680-Pelagomonas_calceolata.AAC.11
MPQAGETLTGWKEAAGDCLGKRLEGSSWWLLMVSSQCSIPKPRRKQVVTVKKGWKKAAGGCLIKVKWGYLVAV